MTPEGPDRRLRPSVGSLGGQTDVFEVLDERGIVIGKGHLVVGADGAIRFVLPEDREGA